MFNQRQHLILTVGTTNVCAAYHTDDRKLIRSNILLHDKLHSATYSLTMITSRVIFLLIELRIFAYLLKD